MTTDEEAYEVISCLPQLPKIDQAYGRVSNAYVFLDYYGRVCILPVSGGFLAAKPSDFQGDIAPWAG